MNDQNSLRDLSEKRKVSRQIVDRYYSVQFSSPGLPSSYQFKLRDISSKGLGLLVREDSEVLNHIKPGDVIEMKYCPADSYDPPDVIKTRIAHITPCKESRFEGHCLVGLYIIEKISD